MGLKEDILAKTKEINTATFKVEETLTVPNIDNSKLSFGCTGLIFEATVLFIDVRGSTAILNKHNKRAVAKLHVIYYHAIVRIATDTGGEIRSFNGDSLLVFYPGKTKDSLSNAVKAAMQMRYAITELINETLTSYVDINFGIGIDHGRILATKVGVGGDSTTKDLIWIGNPVNKAAKISDECKSPHYIGVSCFVYENLTDNVTFGTQKNTYGQDEKVNMWTRFSLTYNGATEYFYKTNWWWPF